MSNTIDILLATYNGGEFIDKQIKSLVTQDRDDLDIDLRLIIRDDGSTDNTLDIIKKRLEYYRAKRENPMEVHRGLPGRRVKEAQKGLGTGDTSREAFLPLH